MLPSTQAAIEGQVEVRWEREGGGWGVYQGRNDGWLCVGTVPRPACPLVKGASASANLQCRSPPPVNGWHKAGPRSWQMSFPF